MVAAGQDLFGWPHFSNAAYQNQNELSSYMVESSPRHPNKCYTFSKTKLGEWTLIDNQLWVLRLNMFNCTEAKMIRNITQRKNRIRKNFEKTGILIKWLIQETSMCKG